jgi:seryl-tRNA synthetase
MIDPRLLREQPDRVKENYARRGADAVALVDAFLEIDAQWRFLRGQEDELRAKRNGVSAAINEAKKAGRDAADLLANAKHIPLELATLEAQRKDLEEKQQTILLRLPNLLDDAVPQGSDDSENKPIVHWGDDLKDALPVFERKPHGEIAELLGSDFTRSAKISGAGFYFLRGELALLNRALIEFAIHHLVAKGYVYTEPPLMMRTEPYAGVTSLSDFEDVQYAVDGSDLKLIATAEHPLVAQFMNEELLAKELPLRLVGYSMCFRKEIGSKGVDTKGLFRTHQFNKVEQVIICSPEDSESLHRELLRNTEELFQALRLPYRVVDVCTGDMGVVAARKYDIEGWMARQGVYREIASCSNCTEWQSRRLGIRYQHKGELRFVHTLNNTAIATSRALVAILENNQQPDGSVTVPAVLVPLMGGITRLQPSRLV